MRSVVLALSLVFGLAAQPVLRSNHTSGSYGGSNQIVVAYTGPSTAGDLLVATVHLPNTSVTISGVSDGSNGAWSGGTSNCLVAANGATEAIYYFANNAGTGTLTVTTALSGPASGAVMAIAEFGGMAGSNVLNNCGNNNGWAGNPLFANVTATAANELLYASVYLASTNESGGSNYSYTNIYKSGALCGEYAVPAASGTLSAQFTNGNPSSGAWNLVAATFCPSGGCSAVIAARHRHRGIF